MNAPTRRLTICVDDFGLHRGINEAAATLARIGRISAVSCMVGAPAWQAGVSTLHAVDGLLDVGLHLDLTEHPVLAASRKPLGEWIVRGALGRIDARGLRLEIAAQLDCFEAGLGRPPTHVDGHQHVHQFQVVREELLALLSARYPGRLPWLRSTRTAPRTAAAPRFKARVIEALGERGLRRLCEQRGFRQNGHLLGVYGFDGGAERYLALLATWLDGSADGDVLMCHPSRDPAGPSLPAARHWEFEVLGGASFGALLSTACVRVAPPAPSA